MYTVQRWAGKIVFFLSLYPIENLREKVVSVQKFTLAGLAYSDPGETYRFQLCRRL